MGEDNGVPKGPLAMPPDADESYRKGLKNADLGRANLDGYGNGSKLTETASAVLEGLFYAPARAIRRAVESNREPYPWYHR